MIEKRESMISFDVSLDVHVEMDVVDALSERCEQRCMFDQLKNIKSL